MSDHVMEFTLHGDTISAELKCREPLGAPCRTRPDWSCNIEGWINADDAMDCAGRFPPVKVGSLLVHVSREGEWYSWAPAKVAA